MVSQTLPKVCGDHRKLYKLILWKTAENMHTARDRHTYYVLSQEKSQIIDRELLLECRLLTRQEHIHSWTNSVHEKMSVTTRQRPPIIDKGPALPTTEDNLSNLVQAPSINIIL